MVEDNLADFAGDPASHNFNVNINLEVELLERTLIGLL
jgi:hypothetical protein